MPEQVPPTAMRLVFQAPLTPVVVSVGLAKGVGYEATLIKPGVYQPGIGNPKGQRIKIGAPVLEKMTPGWDGTPIAMQHGGPVAGSLMEPKYVGGVHVFVGLDDSKPGYASAVSFVQGKFDRKQVPNISMEVGAPRYAPAPAGETGYDIELVDGKPEGAALVDEGACNDKDGCGLGLTAIIPVHPSNGDDTQENQNNMDDKKTEAGLGCSCGKPDAVALQASNKTLSEQVLSLTKQRDEAASTVAAYEKAENESLDLALKAAAPVGTDMKAVLGDEPTLLAKRIALRAFATAKPAEPATGGAGRKTVVADKTTTAPASGDRLLALRKQYNLIDDKGASKLPKSMQANTDRILAGLPEGAQTA